MMRKGHAEAPIQQLSRPSFASRRLTLCRDESRVDHGCSVLGLRAKCEAAECVASGFSRKINASGFLPPKRRKPHDKNSQASYEHEGEMTKTGSVATGFNLAERAKAVATLADKHAEFGDEKGQLAEPVVEALHREGLYGMWVPRSVRDGAELDPVSSIGVIENLSYGDPSAGWVLMASALAIGTGAAFLGDAAVEELFKGDRLPVIAGQGTRPGIAVPKDGGFLLSGSWSFASGIKHGTHIHTLGVIDGTGEPRIFVLPVGQAKLVENWDVLGLRGTGSIDYVIDSVFVPDRVHPLCPARNAKAGRQPLHDWCDWLRRDVPLLVGVWHRSSNARRTRQERPRQGRTCWHSSRQRRVSGGLRQGRSHVSLCPCVCL